ncbi:carbohydrate ABC transporter permease [Demequina maris]|uniref:carbohydrate ABC transporter permease n=1 Tax=Demequina maris TaxID=1638982 RepID=UPI000783D6E3|nr:sugar ABC transporter permease [Demequina maris]
MIARRPLAALSFLAPAVIIYLVVVIYPLISSARLSLTDSPAGNVGEFIGLENFRQLFGDPDVMSALWRTLAYAGVVVVVQNGLGLILARAFFRRIRAQRPLSVMLLLPMLISPLMAAFIWSALYAPNGAVNAALEAIGLDSLTRIWLGDPTTALWAIAFVNVWMFAGYSCAIFLAGYMNMSNEVLEAARVDGADGWRRFRHVEWPLLAPALTVNVTLALIGSLKVFEYPLVMTNGGPAGSTTTLTLVIYQTIFGGQGSFGYGVAIALLLLAVVVVLSTFVNGFLRRREERI